MLLHSDTITLFSRVRGARGQADTWVRHVLAGVKVEAKTAMTPGTTGDVPGHYVLLLVPKAAIGSLTCATPEAYQAADDRSGLIAFQPGDYFCRGDHDWAEYDALCKVTECHRITSCVWFPLIAHFEVTAS